MPTPSIYSPAVAQQVCDALAAGRWPATIARMLGITRTTLYNWKREHPDFAVAWEQATRAAADALEEMIYDQARGGNLDAARYWLKSFKPAVHDRMALVKLAMLQVTLAALQKKGGGEPPALILDENGLPTVASARGSDLAAGSAMPLIATLVMPYNERDREGPRPIPVDDGSGRTLPLPSKAMAIVDQNGELLSLVADGKPVAPGAVRSLWVRICAYNELARASGPARSDRSPVYGTTPESTPLAESTDDEESARDAITDAIERTEEITTVWDAASRLSEDQLDPVLESAAEPKPAGPVLEGVTEPISEPVEAASAPAAPAATEETPVAPAARPAPAAALPARHSAPTMRDFARWRALAE